MRLGLRLEWLLAFGALLVLSFLPLFFAVARLTETSLGRQSQQAAKLLGREIGERLAEVASAHGDASGELVEIEASRPPVTAIAFYDGAGDLIRAWGPEREALPSRTDGHGARPNDLPAGLQRGRMPVTVDGTRGGPTVTVLLAVDSSERPTSALVKLMALYTGIVALGLLVFGYISMTRLVVRPIEQLSRGAGSVAAGARTLALPTSGASELRDLGTSLRAMTEKLRADEESLRTKVRELEEATSELKSAQETLVRSERLASVGRLAAGLAHEIGNPLSAILGFQELLIEGGLSEEETRDFLSRMKGETERIHRVLRDLLDFARSPQSTSSARGMSDPRRAIDAVVTLVKPQRQVQHLNVGTDLAEKLSSVAISEERLVQVLLNLVLNAADVARTKVTLSAKMDGAVVVLSVADDGPGIAKEVEGNLFEPFVTTKEPGKGTGLGLAVCKGLVESAGGTISGENSERGAVFVVRLPVVGEHEIVG